MFNITIAIDRDCCDTGHWLSEWKSRELSGEKIQTNNCTILWLFMKSIWTKSALFLNPEVSGTEIHLLTWEQFGPGLVATAGEAIRYERKSEKSSKLNSERCGDFSCDYCGPLRWTLQLNFYLSGSHAFQLNSKFKNIVVLILCDHQNHTYAPEWGSPGREGSAKTGVYPWRQFCFLPFFWKTLMYSEMQLCPN